ncbi:EF-hand calcium-binding domain-containing protein 1 [Homalodisca vitripennis]|nr:EF-hand calcium-binding domain-containing protein 1 [Homalodisca vitripennis]
MTTNVQGRGCGGDGVCTLLVVRLVTDTDNLAYYRLVIHKTFTRYRQVAPTPSTGSAKKDKLPQKSQTQHTAVPLMMDPGGSAEWRRQEIEALSKVYKKLVESHSLNGPVPATPAVHISSIQANIVKGEGLDRMVFRELLHNTFDVVTEEVLMDRIFCAFDRCNVGLIRLEEWVCGLSGFLRGSHEERTAFAFFVYDLNSDGFISREEMFHLLRNSLVKSPQDEDPDEGVRDLVELALRKMDYDRDGKISFQDFKNSVTDEPLLLEAFGQCLPADTACQTFLSTLQC